MSGTAGASRMSSVRGLNASPQTAIRFPLSEPKCALQLVEQPQLLALVDRLDRLQDLEVVVLVGARSAASP